MSKTKRSISTTCICSSKDVQGESSDVQTMRTDVEDQKQYSRTGEQYDTKHERKYVKAESMNMSLFHKVQRIIQIN